MAELMGFGMFGVIILVVLVILIPVPIYAAKMGL